MGYSHARSLVRYAHSLAHTTRALARWTERRSLEAGITPTTGTEERSDEAVSTPAPRDE